MAGHKPVLIILVVLVGDCHCAPAGDLVDKLPGFTGTLPSRLYSGYVGVDGDARVHYMLVESERAPATDPVVVWFNGGPPCSSALGLFTEVGPLVPVYGGAGGGDASVVLRRNPWSWSRAATLVVLETPLGVGFSYNATAPTAASYAATDSSTAALNLGALLALFGAGGAFAELGANPLFLAGESYAGVYVPLLAQRLVASSAPLRRSLAGVLVGNGAVATGAWYEDGLAVRRTDFLAQHALFPASLHVRLRAACGNFTARPRPPACESALRAVADAAGDRLNVYDVRQTCRHVSDDYSLLHNLGLDLGLGLGTGANPRARALVRGLAADPCLGTAPLIEWMNAPAVRRALHVGAGAAPSPAGDGGWVDCGGSFGRNVRYTREQMDERQSVYPALLRASVPLLIYNGDQDVCIPYSQDEEWTVDIAERVGLESDVEWRPWVVAQQVAGYERRWGRNLTFATVKGAGHMVPATQGQRALAMLTRFLGGTPLSTHPHSHTEF
eukprot:g3484.t1